MATKANLTDNPHLYRAILSCKIGRDAIDSKTSLPKNISAMEWAIYNMLHAVEEIAEEMAEMAERNKEDA